MDFDDFMEKMVSVVVTVGLFVSVIMAIGLIVAIPIMAIVS